MSEGSRLPNEPRTELAWAVFFARALLALIFLMAGWFKVFGMGPVGHAEHYFLSGYSDSWIPDFLLWALGVTIPFVELGAGLFLLVGLRVRETLVVLGVLLLVVTYGHLLAEPLFDLTGHVLPRALLVIGLLAAPRAWDRFTVDAWIQRRAAARRRRGGDRG